MKYTTLDEIEICREIIRGNTERVEAITRIANEMAGQLKDMTPNELERANEELAEMRTEMAALKKAIRSAKLAIKEFYAPAMVI